jgi:putative redox protein
MTLRFYVQRHNWDLRRAIVEVRHKKAVAADGTSTVDQFYRAIHLDGYLSEEQRLKLLQIAERCPVSETLRHSSIIESSLADDPLPFPA